MEMPDTITTMAKVRNVNSIFARSESGGDLLYLPSPPAFPVSDTFQTPQTCPTILFLFAKDSDIREFAFFLRFFQDNTWTPFSLSFSIILSKE